MSQEILVKSKDRIENFGEVFTPIKIVNDMLDNIPSEMFEKDKTFLEPSCGEGIFLVEILKRKLKDIDTKKDAVWCISTLYGIDIQEDNIKATRKNLFDLWKEWSNGKYDDADNAVKNILNANIILGDFLNSKDIEITEYGFSEETDDVTLKTEKIDNMAGEEVKIMSFFDEYEEIIKKYWQI